ncbi:MAG TPA: phage portal protein [Thermotogota bacterium]|nr:phage portal protein [Thermotogota bacterium]
MKTNLWKLYQGKAYDELYLNDRGLPGNTKKIYNSAPLIINMDISMILKGFNVAGKAAEIIIASNDWEYSKENLTLKILLEGRAWVDVAKVEDDVILSVLISDEVPEIKYDAGGNITYAKIKIEADDEKIVKEYYPDRIIQTVNEETTELPNLWGFIPLVEFTAEKAEEDAVSRIENLIDTIDLINEYHADIKAIGKLHSDPLAWGNVRLNSESLQSKDEEKREDTKTVRQMRYVPVPDGGQMQFLEMSGNVMKIMADEKDKLIEQVQNEYPEIVLAQISEGAAQTGYAVEMKLTGLTSIISRYRSILEIGLEKVFEYGALMLGMQDDTNIVFEPVIPKNATELITNLSVAVGSGIIDKETATKEICKALGIDAAEVLKRIKEQAEEEDLYSKQWAATEEQADDSDAKAS